MKINIDSSIFGQAMQGQPEAVKVLNAAARTARMKEKMKSLRDELFMVELAEERAQADYQTFVNQGQPEGDETMAAERVAQIIPPFGEMFPGFDGH